jgi:glycosyltransferase involved in cell wall biosynthesis
MKREGNIYVDARRVDVQGQGIPHGGGFYTHSITDALNLEKTDFKIVETDAGFNDVNQRDIIISASCYDLIYKDLPGRKIYIFHGARDEELYENGDLQYYSKIKYAIYRKLFNRRLSLKGAKLIFPSITTKYMFEIRNQIEIVDFAIAAAPTLSISGDNYKSRFADKSDTMRTDFIFLNADRSVKNFRRVIDAVKMLRFYKGKQPKIYYTSSRPLLDDDSDFVHLSFGDRDALRGYLKGRTLLFPSLSEGFGLPLQDHNGLKIVSGSLTLMWEHNSPDCISVNPRSVIEIAAAIRMTMERKVCASDCYEVTGLSELKKIIMNL